MSDNNSTYQQLSQEESRDPDVADTVVQTVDDRTGVPAELAGPFAETEVGWERMEVDPATFKVMLGRKNKRPSRAKVKALMEAIQRGERIPPITVYQNRKTGERFSPDGGHRQAAYQELGMLVPIILIIVDGASQRAEEESCSANKGNGLHRSRGDQRFQLEKARGIFYGKYKKQPKPSDLVKMTNVSHPACAAFLREALAPKQVSPKIENDAEQQKVLGKLKKAHDALLEITPKDDWIASEEVMDTLKEIGEEVTRIRKYKFQGVKVTPDDLQGFMETNSLTLEQIGQLVGVKHTTVSRWLSGKTKMTPRNQLVLRQALALAPEQIADVLEKIDG